jgi:hypothetical protein
MTKRTVFVLAFPALPGLWLAYTWYDLSVRYGTADPCERIAEQLTDETMKATDLLWEFNPLLRRERPAELDRQLAGVRKHGALACWRSVLFGTPTETEISHAVVMEAHRFEESWDSWKNREDRAEDSRILAVLGANFAEVDVLAQLLSVNVSKAAEILKAVLAEYPGKRADVEAAVRQRCHLAVREPANECIARNFALLGLPK